MEQTVAELPIMDRAWTWFQANKKPILWGTGAVFVAGFAFSFFYWRSVQVEQAAGDALSQIEATRVFQGAQAVVPPEAYTRVASEHAGTKAAGRALLQAGGIYFTQGKYAEAQAQFQKFLNEYPDSPLRAQSSLGIAACLDALAKPDEAATAYKAVIDRNPGEAVTIQAKFALARVYETQNKLSDALKLYEDLARGEASGSIANESGLRADELRAKLPPPPAAAPVTVTPAVPEVIAAPTAAQPAAK